jgi:hypothetical protein
MATNPLLPRPDDSGLQRRQLAAVPSNSGSDSHIQILLPERFYSSLGRRLLSHIRDLLFPQKYPPLRNLSQPVNVILPLGEMLRAPWYRTIFTNLGDVLAPENLPPLQLESRPAEVEELISDLTAEPWWRSLLRSLGEAISPEQLPPLELESRPAEVEELISDSTGKPWWKSLIRNIADAISPEVLPALELSATPINPGISEVGLVTPHWSSLISAPAVSATPVRSVESVNLPVHAVAHTEPRAPQRIPESLPVPLEALQVDADSVDVLVAQFQDNLSRSKRREVIWISLASAEMIFLIALAAGLLH